MSGKKVSEEDRLCPPRFKPVANTEKQSPGRGLKEGREEEYFDI